MPKRQVDPQQILSRHSGHDRVVRIVQGARHGGVRTIITGNKHCETRSMPLIKGGGAIQTEAGVEPVFAKLMEMRPDVVRIVSQPYRVELLIHGAPCTMINDFAVLYANGWREVVEIKGSTRKLRDPHYARKLELAGSAYAAYGLGFRTVTASDPEIADAVVRDNVDLAFVCRFVPVLESHKTNAARLMKAAGGETTLGRLGSVLHPNPLNGRAIAYAMMARRHVAIDMTRPFSDASRVCAVPPLPAHLPSLRLQPPASPNGDAATTTPRPSWERSCAPLAQEPDMPDTNRIPPSHHPTRAAVCNAVATHAIRIAETGGEEILLLRSSRAAGAVTMTVGDVVELLEDLA